MPLRRVISGGQTGADQAGLVVAKRFGIETGGTIPKSFRTLKGSCPELGTTFGLVEHASDNYVPRTYQNVRDADVTVRLAGNFSSRGEACTLKAITQYAKPYFDVDLTDPRPVDDFVTWLLATNAEVLNVAGNAEETYKGAFQQSVAYLTEAFFKMGFEMKVTDEEILRLLGLESSRMIVYTEDRRVLDFVHIRQIKQGVLA